MRDNEEGGRLKRYGILHLDASESPTPHIQSGSTKLITGPSRGKCIVRNAATTLASRDFLPAACRPHGVNRRDWVDTWALGAALVIALIVRKALALDEILNCGNVE